MPGDSQFELGDTVVHELGFDGDVVFVSGEGSLRRLVVLDFLTFENDVSVSDEIVHARRYQGKHRRFDGQPKIQTQDNVVCVVEPVLVFN